MRKALASGAGTPHIHAYASIAVLVSRPHHRAFIRVAATLRMVLGSFPVLLESIGAGNAFRRSAALKNPAFGEMRVNI
ncbi:hypothetical protein AB2B41_12690 [Marimonas sp. MJW-29]|uniref:Uncharacterized protein n=1 Tax=Sulfitobacter sediminis TaxID=3234186 RepID=A0ABV3RNC4_9RHOB